MSLARPRVGVLLVVGLAGLATVAGSAQDGETPSGEWPYFGGTRAFTRYAPLDQIDRRNVANLRVLWRRPAIDAVFTQAFPELRPSNYLRSTPIMVDGILYASNAAGHR